MSEEFLMFVLFPTLAFTVTGGAAYWLGTMKTRFGMAALAGVWLVFTGWMFFGLETANGFDGLIYFFGLLLVSLPASLGALIGGVLGWKQKDVPAHA